jgi:hypothetical protein
MFSAVQIFVVGNMQQDAEARGRDHGKQSN